MIRENLDYKVVVFRKVNEEIMVECMLQCLIDAKELFKYFMSETVPERFGIRLENIEEKKIIMEV